MWSGGPQKQKTSRIGSQISSSGEPDALLVAVGLVDAVGLVEAVGLVDAVGLVVAVGDGLGSSSSQKPGMGRTSQIEGNPGSSVGS